MLESETGIINGSADLILGIGAGDTDIEPQTATPGSTGKGLRLPVSAGDVVIQPAGMAHSQVNGKNYMSIAAYPEVRCALHAAVVYMYAYQMSLDRSAEYSVS